MKDIPFNSDINDVIHRWCQWCVNHGRMVPLQDWIRFTLPVEDGQAIQKAYQDRPARRVDIKAILADPVKRKALMVDALVATQAREGITTTREQAEAAYDKVQQELREAKR